MKKLKIDRKYYRDCTIGRAIFDGFSCSSLELPWRENAANISCIPAGIYPCIKIDSPSLGHCFEIAEVHDRTFVRGHIGNFTHQIKGCVVFGDSVKDIDSNGILDVTNSRSTFKRLMDLLPNEFLLEIGQPSVMQ